MHVTIFTFEQLLLVIVVYNHIFLQTYLRISLILSFDLRCGASPPAVAAGLNSVKNAARRESSGRAAPSVSPAREVP